MKRLMFALAGLAVMVALTVLVFGTLGEGGGKVEGAPGTITAEANGSLTPTPTPWPGPLPAGLTNGDFLISSALDFGVLGDGANEVTNWTFDFCFPANIEPLTSALLTLTLTPRGPVFSTDTVAISGVGSIPTPGVQTLYNAAPGGLTRTITVDLLTDPLSNMANPAGAAALFTLFQTNVGKIPMRYQDDAIISFAKLELEPASCPVGVGGTTDLLTDGSDAPRSAAEGSSSGSDYTAAIAGAAALAAAAVALAAGGWYARRRWMR